MGLLEKEVFICLDCETTGLDAKADRVIEVAAIQFTLGEILNQFDSLINPECPIPETSIAIHHITPEMVADKPTMVQVLPELLDFIGHRIIVGHGVRFDMELVANAADRAGIPHRLMENRSFDTLRLARLYGESPTNSLEQLRQHFQHRL